MGFLLFPVRIFYTFKSMHAHPRIRTHTHVCVHTHKHTRKQTFERTHACTRWHSNIFPAVTLTYTHAHTCTLVICQHTHEHAHILAYSKLHTLLHNHTGVYAHAHRVNATMQQIETASFKNCFYTELHFQNYTIFRIPKKRARFPLN